MNKACGQETKSVRDIIEDFPEVHSVERTRDSDEYGRWIVITKTSDKSAVLNHLNHSSLAHLYKAQGGQRRLITAGSREIQTDKNNKTIVRTYAEILNRKYAKYEETNDAPMETPNHIPRGRTQQTQKTPHQQPLTQAPSADPDKDNRTPLLSQSVEEMAKRLATLENNQVQLQSTADKLAEDNTLKHTQDTINSLAEKQNQLLQFEVRMEQKLHDIEQREKIDLQAAEKEIIKSIDKKIEAKLHSVSFFGCSTSHITNNGSNAPVHE